MNGTKHLVGKLGIVMCSALLGAQTGCVLPGKHGGPPGLPPLPGLPRGELPHPSRVASVTTASKDPGRNDSLQLAQSKTSVNAVTTEGEPHE